MFTDEVHRFSKAQPGVLLPAVKDGVITLIGAATENPSFSANAALVRRSILMMLKPISIADIVQFLARALNEDQP